MKQDIYNNIDYEWLNKPTGDPFTDIGGYALEEFSTYFPEANIMELIVKAAKIYVNNWNKKIDSFFLNSPTTQAQFKGKEIEKITDYFETIINNFNASKGYCRITGKYGYVFASGRHNSILTGSSTFSNFHHNFQEGIMVSKEVLIRNFFTPLACEQLLGKNVIILGNSFDLSSFFARMLCKQNMECLSNKPATGIYKSKFKSANTALFHFADEVLLKVQPQFENEDKCNLQLYMFTNYASCPNLQTILLPLSIWQFNRFVKKGKYRDTWQAFVSHFFYAEKKTRNGIETISKYKNGKYEFKEGKEIKEVGEDCYKYWSNYIYDCLLKKKSILKYILDYVKENKFDFIIVKYYTIKIRNMKKETIEKIEQMADFIIEAKDEYVKKAIINLNAANSSFSLRRFIINNIVKRYYEEKKEEAIVTVNDYVSYLFPDIESWKETRDVLLIAIYEKLHNQKRFITI